MELDIAAACLAALGHETRLSIYRLLIQAGPDGLTAGKLAELTGLPPSSLSFHLKALSNVELVDAQQNGRFVIYSAHYETMNAMLAYLTDNCCGGSPCTPDACATPKTTGKSRR